MLDTYAFSDIFLHVMLSLYFLIIIVIVLKIDIKDVNNTSILNVDIYILPTSFFAGLHIEASQRSGLAIMRLPLEGR